MSIAFSCLWVEFFQHWLASRFESLLLHALFKVVHAAADQLWLQSFCLIMSIPGCFDNLDWVNLLSMLLDQNGVNFLLAGSNSVVAFRHEILSATGCLLQCWLRLYQLRRSGFVAFFDQFSHLRIHNIDFILHLLRSLLASAKVIVIDPIFVGFVYD